MRTFIIPSKDTTIYQAYPTNNSGLDEILEIGKTVDTSIDSPSYVSSSARSLLYFDLPTTQSVSPDATYFLNLKLANVTKVQRNQNILVYLVSQSWSEGSGYFYQNIENSNDGATWKQINSSTSWSMSGGDFLLSGETASISLTEYPIQDLRIDVTNIFRPIVSQSLQSTFYGLGLQFPINDEIDENNEGNIKLFSSQTHTIHQPTLEIAWDNQIYNTGSLSKIPSSLNVKVACSDLKEYYELGDVTRINITVRDKYPLRSFDSVLRYKNKYYLPSSSYYSIIDTQANVTVVPFDEFSKINCDTNGSYIDLDTSLLYKNRFYTLKFKIQSGSYSKTINSDTIFKII